MNSLSHRHVVVSGVRLNYLERAPDRAHANAPPLLLLHGLLATAETLAELISFLPQRRIVALDLLSAEDRKSGSKPAVDFASLARLVHGFLQVIGLTNPVVLGHSHGGAISQRLAASHPGLFRGMVLLCPAHPFEGYRSHVVNFYLTRHGRMLALSIPLAPRWAILRAYNQAAGPKSRIRMRHLQPYMRVLRNRDTLRLILQMLHTWETDMAELRSAMTARLLPERTLLIWGDADTVVPIATADDLQKHLPNSQRVTLPGIGHLLAEEAPAACAGFIGDWLIQQQL